MKEKITAVVLAAGQGKRMKSAVQKQYLLLNGKPVLYYSLKAIEDSFIDEIILVVGPGEIEYCKKNIVHKYNFQKIGKIVEGGKERYHSVYQGILAAGECDYILIHDGARPFVDSGILDRVREAVKKYSACAAAMPAKDTVKIADDGGFAIQTPDRRHVWLMQTPQAFSYNIIKQAYTALMEQEKTLTEKGIMITDDAMVLETFGSVPIKLVEGAYRNIKITTPEDLIIGQNLLLE